MKGRSLLSALSAMLGADLIPTRNHSKTKVVDKEKMNKAEAKRQRKAEKRLACK